MTSRSVSVPSGHPIPGWRWSTLVNVDRIVVLGRGGAGESVFARTLGAQIGAEVIELDKVFWSEPVEPLTTDE
jgi:hypothetical protein